MLNSVKQNNALKKSGRNKFKEGNNYVNIKTSNTEYNIPKVSEKELIKIKEKIKEEAKQ